MSCPTAADRRREIRGFILGEYLRGSTETSLRDDDLLFESGMIDSTGAIALVLFLEERFGFTITDAELFPRNFASVERIHEFVERKLARAPRAANATTET
jgi:methoxymalonate biosynthesis acyl carrier protein